MKEREAIEWIRSLVETMHHETNGGLYPDPEYRDEVYEALDIAIRALEQEQVLDKIRAEIEQEAKDYDKIGYYERGLWLALGIIDKHKAESE